MRKKIALFSLLLILVIVNVSIIGKEKHLAEGTVVYLELTPVDPRSLMQGDYMALRFQLASDIYSALPKNVDTRRWRQDINAGDGRVIVTLNEKGIGSFKHIFNDQPLQKNDILMRYRIRAGAVKLASNAFFFQEGHARDYEAARYGRFRVDSDGELLLESMHDEHLKKLGPTSK